MILAYAVLLHGEGQRDPVLLDEHAADDGSPVDDQTRFIQGSNFKHVFIYASLNHESSSKPKQGAPLPRFAKITSFFTLKITVV
jgi:hypothetical protein